MESRSCHRRFEKGTGPIHFAERDIVHRAKKSGAYRAFVPSVLSRPDSAMTWTSTQAVDEFEVVERVHELRMRIHPVVRTVLVLVLYFVRRFSCGMQEVCTSGNGKWRWTEIAPAGANFERIAHCLQVSCNHLNHPNHTLHRSPSHPSFLHGSWTLIFNPKVFERESCGLISIQAPSWNTTAYHTCGDSFFEPSYSSFLFNSLRSSTTLLL